ncbi:dethiobiotin synthase [Elizabethkingia anophelis]|uniref:dethiobiotin synthase n=1 Tax=Elizabethkingia anophelis TaxID=1117645 RepID=UPI0021A7C452|nr:dethiobiotin synthase [Elizabethkingia anophelis]MCT4135973.1 dethiobiotin synthase [Elizabethkingia anophelis]MCT4298159.1 dethiobiotin synthase [Elizabethkingia anophelis]MCT4302017.1 dethiobiotin synthase [Elizabethkingia anophelis]
MNTKYFITGIGTGIGKTVSSAILRQYFQADYWKPVQSGDLDQSDSMLVKQLTSDELRIHPERFRLQYPASPHQSAAMEGIEIKISDFQLPVTESILLVEGAGGLFVPLNHREFIIDLIEHFNIPVILVVRDYLGCINHTLLSLEVLKLRNIEVAYVIFNGNFVPETREVLLKHIPENSRIIELPEVKDFTRVSIQEAVDSIRRNLK